MAQLKLTISNTLLLLAFGSLLQIQLMPNVAVAAPAAASDDSMSKEIAAMEHKFFVRHYDHDPIEKRLERLELLVFGSTQPGDNISRYGRLQKAIVHQASGSTTAAGKAAAQKGQAQTASGHYPALNNLEWRALKKTFPNDPLAVRLDRLEKKVFGSESSSMAYVDRVDRLKRTLGVDAPAPRLTAVQPPIIGPAPRARARGFMSPDNFGSGSPPMIGNNEDDDEADNNFGFGFAPGFASGFGLGMPSSVGSMLKEMDRQMAQLQHLPPGQYTFDQKNGGWIDRNTGRRLSPGSPGNQMMPPAFMPPTGTSIPKPGPKKLPFQLSPRGDSELPPYSDPNSI